MADLSDIDSELLALARKDAREVMKRCDVLIARAEAELSKLVQRREGLTGIAAATACKAGRFTLRLGRSGLLGRWAGPLDRRSAK